MVSFEKLIIKTDAPKPSSAPKNHVVNSNNLNAPFTHYNTEKPAFLQSPEIAPERELSTVTPISVVQRVLNVYGVNDRVYTQNAVRWNRILAEKDIVHGVHPFQNNAAIVALIAAREDVLGGTPWMEKKDVPNEYKVLHDFEHRSESTVVFNAVDGLWASAFRDLKAIIKAGLDLDKRNAVGDTAGMGWGAIIPYLRDTLQPIGYLGFVFQYNVDLTGGHGKGDTWEARVAGVGGAAKCFGAIPYATHGLGTGALHGSLGEVRNVIALHNDSIDNYYEAHFGAL